MMPRFRLTPSRPLKMAEKHVVEQCVQWLGLRGYRCERLQVGKFKTADNRWITIGTKGNPDWIAIHEKYPGFYVEFKRPGGELSPEQLVQHEVIRQGFHLSVVTIERLEELAVWLAGHEAAARRQWLELLKQFSPASSSTGD